MMWLGVGDEDVGGRTASSGLLSSGDALATAVGELRRIDLDAVARAERLIALAVKRRAGIESA